jgi:hypothetical protein
MIICIHLAQKDVPINYPFHIRSIKKIPTTIKKITITIQRIIITKVIRIVPALNAATLLLMK